MYRLLYPLRTYLVTSGRVGEEVDVMAADWVTVVSANPFMVAVAISPKRYTFRLVKKYGEFVIAVPGLELIDDVWVVGTESGPSKLSKTRLTLEKGRRVSAPVIKEALANLECRVVGEHPYGDHVLFVGEVVAYSYRDDAFRGGEPDLSAGFMAHIAWNKFTGFKQEVKTPGKNPE